MVSEAQKRATAKYNKSAYFESKVRFPKKIETEIRTAAGESLNGFIVSAVLEKLERMKQAETVQPATDHTQQIAKPAENPRVSEYRQTLQRLNYSAEYIEKEIERFKKNIKE